MYLYLKYQVDRSFRKVLSEELREQGIDLTIVRGQTVKLESGYDTQQLKAAEGTLKDCGIEINQKSKAGLFNR